MRKINQMFQDSFREFKSTKTLCVLGMLGALSIVFYMISSQFDFGLQLTLDPLCNIMASCLFGPAAGAIFGGAMDLLNFVINPRGPLCIGLTFNAVLSGIFMGTFLYKKKITIPRVFLVCLINDVVINAVLGTFWLALMYGKNSLTAWIITWFPSRLSKNLVMPVFEALVIVAVYKALEKGGLISLLRQPLGHKRKS